MDEKEVLKSIKWDKRIKEWSRKDLESELEKWFEKHKSNRTYYKGKTYKEEYLGLIKLGVYGYIKDLEYEEECKEEKEKREEFLDNELKKDIYCKDCNKKITRKDDIGIYVKPDEEAIFYPKAGIILCKKCDNKRWGKLVEENKKKESWHGDCKGIITNDKNFLGKK